MKDDQHKDMESEEQDISLDTEPESSGFNRRKFIKTAVATAPVVMTITSRPVFAANCSESGQLSGNLSGWDDCEGEGCTPGFWKQEHKFGAWHYNYQPDDLFSDVFGVNPFEDDPSLWQVVDLAATVALPDGEVLSGTNDPDDPVNNYLNVTSLLGAHAVAALQNAATDIKYPYTVKKVIESVNTLEFTVAARASIETQKTEFDFLNNEGCPY